MGGRPYRRRAGWGKQMGMIIDFPEARGVLRPRPAVMTAARGEVVILPVIRIERYDDEPVLKPARGGDSGGRRRRRASRS